MSLLDSGTCIAGNPLLPPLLGIPIALGDPRLMPLQADTIYTQSILAVAQGAAEREFMQLALAARERLYGDDDAG